MNRREFLMWVGVGGVASSLPIAIAACSPQTKKSESPTSPCHDAKYSPDGKVLKSPAEKPLPTYEAKVEGDSVLVKAS